MRYEREHSNSLWHTDWKQLDDGRWFLRYEDDASRFVTGYGVFENPTAENALAVLDAAIRDHGRPASIMTDHGSQFYANEKEGAGRGASESEKRLVKLGIRQILTGVRHPQTNGKLERLHGEIQRKLPRFEAVMMRTSEPIDLFMNWYRAVCGPSGGTRVCVRWACPDCRPFSLPLRRSARPEAGAGPSPDSRLSP